MKHNWLFRPLDKNICDIWLEKDKVKIDLNPKNILEFNSFMIFNPIERQRQKVKVKVTGRWLEVIMNGESKYLDLYKLHLTQSFNSNLKTYTLEFTYWTIGINFETEIQKDFKALKNYLNDYCILDDFYERYQIIKKIGEGSVGIVSKILTKGSIN